MRITLITEGVSENRIIKDVINKFFKEEEEEIFFRDAQPQIVNDKQETNGGWNEVLKFCSRTEDLKEIFRSTDYLVIQIDTDLSQTKPFDISHYGNENILKTSEELCNDVIDKLKSLISPEVLESFDEKILFAVCVHSIECWLLPLYYTNNHKSDYSNCLSTLNVELRRKNILPVSLNSKNSVKSVKTYDAVLKNWKKKTHLFDSAQHSPSFTMFLNYLESIKFN